MTQRARPRAVANEEVNLRDFTRGTSNDTARIQSALDAAEGGTLVVPLPASGEDYTCNDVYPSSNTKIIGRGGRILQRTTGTNLFVIESGVENVEFSGGLRLRGTAPADAGVAASQSSNNAIQAVGASNLRVLDADISRFLYFPFVAKNCVDIKLIGGRYYRNAYGPRFAGCVGMTLDDLDLLGTCLYSLTPTALQFSVGIGLESTDGLFGAGLTGATSPCSDFLLNNVRARDFPYGQALLIHAGIGYTVLGFQAKNCSQGVSINPYNATDFIQNGIVAACNLSGTQVAPGALPTPNDIGISAVAGGSTPDIQVLAVGGNRVGGFNLSAEDPELGGEVYGDISNLSHYGDSIHECAGNGIVLRGEVESAAMGASQINDIIPIGAVQNGVLSLGSATNRGSIAGFSFRGLNGGTGVGIKGNTSLITKSGNNYSAVDTDVAA